MDVQTRKLRYFVAVAEELNFSRAAARLFIAQQAMSKQIRTLEQDVGTQLLVRTTRKVELTPAGEIFLDGARSALRTLDDAAAAARRANQVEHATVCIGFQVGAALELTTPLLEEFAARFPTMRLDLREFPLGDPSSGLAEGWADVSLVRLPASLTDVELEPLFVEPRVAAVSAHHRLGDRSAVSVCELLDEPICVAMSADVEWTRYWTLDEYRDGTTVARVLQTSTHTEEMELVAAGVAIAVTVAGAARYTPHPNVHFVPIHDIPGQTLAVAWHTGRRRAAVERFLAVAPEVCAREVGTIMMIEQPFTEPS